MGKNGTNTVDPNTGTITYSGTSESVPSSHKGMPPRTDAYEPTDERGHIQASSLSGPNTRDNVVPQSKDLNHGAYLQMENAERSIDKSGGKVESEKSAFVSNQRGGRPDAFMVNDHVTYANGHEQTVHLSFANLTNEQQESMNQALNAHTDMLNAPNPGDTLRESMSTAEYSQLMEETESYLPSVKEMYDPGTIFADLSQPEAQATLESSASGAGAQNGGLDGTGAGTGGLAGPGAE
ncbi:MAG: DNA/RNA non-specific endonuclease, partial [Eubacteriales bacterium]|nr:DNA/RNA non-specific endonuclease [Eubacteriales bacterium]